MALHQEFKTILAEGLQLLNLYGLLNDENKALLVKHAQHANNLARGMCRLNNKRMLNDENKALLVENAQDAGLLAEGLIRLKRAGLLDDWIKARLAQHAQYACGLAWSVVSLYESKLLKEPFGTENKELLFQHAQFAPALSWVLPKLNSANFFAKPNRQENYILVIRYAQYLEKIQRILLDFNVRILNPKNFETLIQYREFAENFKGVNTQKAFDDVVAKIKEQRYGETYFLMGSHPKSQKTAEGKDNPLYKFFHHEKYDPKLAQMICEDFLPSRKVKNPPLKKP